MFKEGKSFGQYPLRLIWVELEDPAEFPVQFTVSVPKKKFPRAVQRNQLKRKVREAYRLHKHRLYQQLKEDERYYGWMLLYVAKEAVPYAEIEQSMRRIIPRFVKMKRKDERAKGQKLKE